VEHSQNLATSEDFDDNLNYWDDNFPPSGDFKDIDEDGEYFPLNGDFKSSEDDYDDGGNFLRSGELKGISGDDNDFPPSEDFKGTNEDDEYFPPS